MITAEQATEAVTEQPGKPNGVVLDGGDVWLVAMTGDIPINDTVVVVGKEDGTVARTRATPEMDDWPLAVGSLTAAGENQARILKGNPGGGQWVDTPGKVLNEMKDSRSGITDPTQIGNTGQTAKPLGDNSPASAVGGAQPPGQRGDIRNPDYNVNCQKTTATYEMRRRGMDVTAGGGTGDNDPRYGLASYFDMGLAPLEKVLPSGWSATEADVVSHINAARYPIGARGSVQVDYFDEGAGHIFNWEIDPEGTVRFFDGQIGREITGDTAFWDEVTDASFQRLDDLPLRDNAASAVDPSGLTPKKPE